MSTGLLLTIMQLNIAQKKLLDVTSQYERIATVMQQLERDVMGAFIPLQAMPLPKPAESKKEEQSANNQSSPEKSTSPQLPATAVKKQPKPIERIFEGTEKNGQFDTLTFITDNPLSFMQAQNGKLKPRIVRVFYRLEQDQKRKNSFNLTWQEGTNLNATAYTKEAKNELRPYTMIEGIAQMKVHYLMREPEKNEDQKKETASEGQAEKKKTKKRVYKKVSQWKQKKDDKEKMVQLPEAVVVTIELWDSMYEHKRKYSFEIPLFGSLMMQPPHEKKKQEAKPATPPPASPPAPQTVSHDQSPSTKQMSETFKKFGQMAMGKKAGKPIKKKPTMPPDMAWLDQVKLHEGATLTVNGVNYVPTT